MRSFRRFLAILTLAALLAVSACTPEEVNSFVLVNNERTAAGLPTLQVSDEAAVKAKQWAQYLATCDCLVHSRTGVGNWVDWAAVGENIAFVSDGYGTTARAIAAHQALMASFDHRANILSPEWTHVGIGSAHMPSRDRFIIVQVFLAAR